MSHSAGFPESRNLTQEQSRPQQEVGLRCPLPTPQQAPASITPDLCQFLAEEGCPLATPVRDRLRFETLLAELSAIFVNLPAHEVDSQINGALQKLVEFLDVDRAGLAEVLIEQKQLVITHSYQHPGVPLLPSIILDEQLPWYARIVREGKIFQLSNLLDDLPPEATAERAYCQQVGLKSHLMIPLRVMNGVVGAIGFGSFRHSRSWPEELVQRLRLVGEIFTNALARKRADEALLAREQALGQTREGLRELAAKLLHAQEEERRRIAREMHDDWTQRLAILGIEVANLEKHIGTLEKALPLLHSIQAQLVNLSEDVHALSRQLHPAILDDLGLVEALRSECVSFSRRERITVFYHPEKVPANLPPDVSLCIYRVAQEALRNVARHAAAGEAWLTLFPTNLQLVLRIQDRGVGFDPTAARSEPGLGLSSMAERVRLIQAELSITSAPGEGTTLEVRVPLVRSPS